MIIEFWTKKIASPACTDLEVVMMDWLGQLLGLPSQFLACSGGTGGGVIQVSRQSIFFQSSFNKSYLVI